MSREAAAENLLRFVEEVSDASEVIWCAGLAMMRRAVDEAEESRWGRFRVHPGGQLRRFRQDAAAGMGLMRLAVQLQEADAERDRELHEDLHAEAVAAGRRKRRAQTLPAERARAAARIARGVPTTNFHLRPDYPASGLAGGTGEG